MKQIKTILLVCGLLSAAGASAAPDTQSYANQAYGLSVKVPTSFQVFKPDNADDARPIVMAFTDRADVPDDPIEIIATSLGGLLSKEQQATPDKGTRFRMMWRDTELVALQSWNGQRFIVSVPVPLAPEAVVFRFAGSKERLAHLHDVAEALVASIDGELAYQLPEQPFDPSTGLFIMGGALALVYFLASMTPGREHGQWAFYCPECECRMWVPARHLGHDIICTACGHSFTLPAVPPATAASRSPRQALT
jgi:hypothetical protein